MGLLPAMPAKPAELLLSYTGADTPLAVRSSHALYNQALQHCNGPPAFSVRLADCCFRNRRELPDSL